MAITLPPWIIEKIQQGEAILFLGAGASKGAYGPRGEHALSGLELKIKLCDKFLGGQKKDRPLAEVAEFSKYESSLVEVQRYIRQLGTM